MMRRLGQVLALAGMIAGLASCGGSSSGSGNVGGGGTPGFFIVIQGLAYSPATLSVPPGATVTVMNRDAMPHSVTSESMPGAFTPGAVSGVQFDSGAATGTFTFQVPANAPEGTVIPYYCTVHKGVMATPNASIKIDTSAQPAPPPGSGGGGGSGY